MPSLPLDRPPQSICLLRLSALGDISHTLPLVRTLQAAWPQTRITWIIGKTEHTLVSDIPGIEFIIFDKSRRWRAYLDMFRLLRHRRFDVLLHIQMSIRASLISLFVRAPIRLGFDKTRAKDGQWLFTNHRIEYQAQQHVIDSFLAFATALGVREHQLRWDIPVSDDARRFAQETLPADKKILAISPCSSMAYRNWTIEGYINVANYAIEQLGMHVVLCGGRSNIEAEYRDAILPKLRGAVTDLTGKTSIKQLVAVLARADVLLAPDSGPAHIASALGTAVIGLYACTNPERSGPYSSRAYTINRYPDAIETKFGKGVNEIPWGTRVRDEGTMDRITQEEVLTMLTTVISKQAIT